MTDRPAPPANLPPTPGSQAEADRVEHEVQPVAGAETAGAADAAPSASIGGSAPSNGGSAPSNGASSPSNGASSPDVEVEVECPGCGLVLVGDSSPRPTAAWFCPRCDYPVFWAAPPSNDGSNGQRRARRRLPGTGGRQALGASACWHCGEMNDLGITSCLRCAATLPKPVPPEPEPVLVEVPMPVPVPEVVQTVTWPFVAAAGLAGAAFAIAGTLWVLSIVVGL
jgi:hypothetical protein